VLTPSVVEEFVSALAEHIGSVNQAAEDGDRGPGGKQISLWVADDGSGAIGQRTSSGQYDDWYWFSDHADLVAKMRELGFGFQAPADAVKALGQAQFEISNLRLVNDRLRQTIEAMQLASELSLEARRLREAV
jgi:hypothetical protein